MTGYLMISIGLLTCALGLALSHRTTTRLRLSGEESGQAVVAVRALILAYGVDLVLQLWQIDGGRQPFGVALIDAAITGSIFWLLSFYISALTGKPVVTRPVSVLAATLIVLGVARSVVRVMPPDDARPMQYYILSLAWLTVGLALAVAVATTARRRLRIAGPSRSTGRKADLGWAGTVAWWSYAITAIAFVRTLAAPFMAQLPSLGVALDSPLVDTLLIVVFVALGAATGGLGPVAKPSRDISEVDDETAERRARLLMRSDVVLDREFADPTLTMARLAAAVGCSEHKLSVALNQGRGMNFFAYLNKRRIREATKLMRSGGMTMTEIAFACGYNARSTFYAAFKSVTGDSPANWRAGDGNMSLRVSERADQDTPGSAIA